MADQTETSSIKVQEETKQDGSGTTTVTEKKTTEAPDAMASFAAKMIVAYFTGPKMSAILMAHGIAVDPAVATFVIAGTLHKVHDILKKKTGYDWL